MRKSEDDIKRCIIVSFRRWSFWESSVDQGIRPGQGGDQRVDNVDKDRQIRTRPGQSPHKAEKKGPTACGMDTGFASADRGQQEDKKRSPRGARSPKH